MKHCCLLIKHYLLKKKNGTDMGILKEIPQSNLLYSFLSSFRAQKMHLWTYFLSFLPDAAVFICCYLDILPSKC